jgi:hypothetical protein
LHMFCMTWATVVLAALLLLHCCCCKCFRHNICTTLAAGPPTALLCHSGAKCLRRIVYRTSVTASYESPWRHSSGYTRIGMLLATVLATHHTLQGALQNGTEKLEQVMVRCATRCALGHGIPTMVDD